MAKAGKKKGRLPKEVLGVKLPKELRKAGERVLEQANSPQGREMIAAGLTMAATAAVAALAKDRAKPHAAPEHAQGTQKSPDPQVLADALGHAAEAVLGRVFGKRA